MNATTYPERERNITITAGRAELHGQFTMPHHANGVVLFAHGSGSSRFSSRNQYVAWILQKAGIATLLFDLLDEWEANDREKVFDIRLLANRLNHASDWVRQQPELAPLSLGYFGASTGAGAALAAAAMPHNDVKAVVSRGGRPDLAGHSLSAVRAATLLIVGGDDEPVVALNRMALAELRCEKKLEIIPGATHLFPEPGALEQVAHLASQWFQMHLGLAASCEDCREH